MFNDIAEIIIDMYKHKIINNDIILHFVTRVHATRNRELYKQAVKVLEYVKNDFYEDNNLSVIKAEYNILNNLLKDENEKFFEK
ncbi:hypothetical protein OWM07_03270 [Deferribacter thermophilus]|uniref:hypothetical protein n=1 Tax=Deferribacter thermophilus TaxID=53573 RepID=UPI003C14A69C